MAKPDERTKEDAADEAAPKPRKTKLILMLSACAAALVGISVAATWLAVGGTKEAALEDAAETEEKPAKAARAKDKKTAKKGKKAELANAVYLPLDPPIVVNSRDGASARFLQVSVEAMARDPLVIEDVKKHLPLIRNNLIMLFSSQAASDVSSREGKEQLRAAALAEVQKVIQEQTGRPGVEGLYFTSFVMQ